MTTSLNYSNINFTDLSKKDWDKLNSLNIVTGFGNGFANTTDEFEAIFPINRTLKFISVGGGWTIYGVSYQDGCFYPIWKKITLKTSIRLNVSTIAANNNRLFVKNTYSE